MRIRPVAAGVVSLVGLLSAAVTGCSEASPGGASDGVRAGGSPDSAAVRAIIAAGYRERARLGLGSPFRLIDFVLHDPRLDSLRRLRTARDLLHETARGDLYRIDPVALDGIALDPGASGPSAGVHHLDFIEDAIRRGGDPRAGARAVRLAYGLARLEGSISPSVYAAAVQAAALVRDRELARRDAVRLLRAGRGASTDPVLLVPRWRRSGWLLVEQPPLQPIPAGAEAVVVRQALVLLERLRALLIWTHRPYPDPPPREPSLLGAAAAERLEDIAAATGMPQQSGVVMAVHQTSRAYRSGAHPRWEHAWRALRTRAGTEEALVAQAALLLRREPGLRPAIARLLLLAATELRAYSQEEPWFPGFGGPSPVELAQRYGIDVRFAPEVPHAWRPFYLRALATALADLQEVLPALELRGLTIHIPTESSIEGALASHIPRERVLEWPTRTGPGSLAHEVAHDLDWQAARRSSRARAYVSDLAASRPTTSLGRVLLDLVPEPAELGSGLSARQIAHLRRPAEVLARNFEWFVLSELARRGRSNGYLSSAQDLVLTGHGSVLPPQDDDSGRAVLGALRALLPIPRTAAEHFLRAHGPERPPNAQRVVFRMSRVRLAPLPGAAVSGFPSRPGAWLAPLRLARDSAFARTESWLCRHDPFYASADLASAYRDFIAEAAAARGRALLLGGLRGAGRRAELTLALREFYGPVWPAGGSDGVLPPDLEARIEGVKELGARSHGYELPRRPRPRRCSACVPAWGFPVDARPPRCPASPPYLVHTVP